MYGRKPRQRITAQPPAGTTSIKASDETIENVRQRRKPRKQDIVAAVIAIAIVAAIVLSAIGPFFMY